jgi:hypothetical protein
MEDTHDEEPDIAPRPEGLRAVSTLRDIYLAAGLDREAALRSALADYTHHFLPMEVQCAA